MAPGFAQVLPRRRGALRRCRGPGADGGYAAADGADHHAGAVEELCASAMSDVPCYNMEDMINVYLMMVNDMNV